MVEKAQDANTTAREAENGSSADGENAGSFLRFILLVAQAISEIIKKIAVMRGLIEDPHPFVSAHEAAEMEGAALAAEAGGDKDK